MHEENKSINVRLYTIKTEDTRRLAMGLIMINTIDGFEACQTTEIVLYITLILLSYGLRPWLYFAESVEQDHPSRTCSLILLYTLRYSMIELRV